ncbi:MAG TPA: vitamin K epoxide reductase family protein [Candidatus Limnocylindrales bacterium]
MAKSTTAAARKSLPTGEQVPAAPPSLWRRIRGIHPGLVLAFLDLIGLGIASYLSFEELQNKPLLCLKDAVFDCNAVAQSPYSRPFAGIPVAVYGVFLSLTLFVLAIAWWRTNNYKLLLLHYGLSLVGVLFEGWFQFAQIVLIKKVCIWCESYGISLVLRFFVALWVYLHTPNPDSIPIAELD